MKARSLSVALVAVASAALDLAGCRSAEHDRASISQLAQSRVVSDYSQIKPAWFEQFVTTGSCDHLGVSHPDWNSCFANTGAWINHRTNPQMFPLNFNFPLLDGVSAQVENVAVNGSTATALVTVSGVCRFTDEGRSCVNSGRWPRRPFRTKVVVTLSRSGLFGGPWQIARLEEDPSAAQARRSALASDMAQATAEQAQQTKRLYATQRVMLAA